MFTAIGIFPLITFFAQRSAARDIARLNGLPILELTFRDLDFMPFALQTSNSSLHLRLLRETSTMIYAVDIEEERPIAYMVPKSDVRALTIHR